MTDPAAGLPDTGAEEALLEQLTDALRPLPLQPPPASLAALRRAVERKWRPTARARVTGQLTAWARRLQRKGAAVAVLGGLAVGGTGMALAACGSMPHPIQYTLHDLGIPVPAPAAAHHGGVWRPDHQFVKVGVRATARPAPTPPRRGAEPLASAAPSPVLLVPVRPTGRAASRAGTRAPRPWSAPAASYRDPPRSESGRSTLPTVQTSTSGTYGAYGRVSPSTPGTTSPAPPGPTGPTTPTTWSSGNPTSPWRTGPGWPQTGAAELSAAGSAHPALRSSYPYPRYRTTFRSYP
jgi:hypothetical protein